VGEAAGAVSCRIADQMREWVGSAEQYDDLTCVVLAVNGARTGVDPCHQIVRS
jgi:hypothetical protein